VVTVPATEQLACPSVSLSPTTTKTCNTTTSMSKPKMKETHSRRYYHITLTLTGSSKLFNLKLIESIHDGTNTT